MKKLICIVTDSDYEESILNCYADGGVSAKCENCRYWATVIHGQRSRCMQEDLPEMFTMPDFFCANHKPK